MLGQESPRALSGQAALSPREIRGRRLALLLGVVLSLAGCAGVQEATGVATQQDLLQIRQDVAAAQQTATRAKADADAVSAQLKNRAGGESDKKVAALSRQVDSLSETLTTLTGRVDELSTRLDTLTRQLRTGQAPATSGSAAPRSPSAAPSGSAAPASPGTAAPGPVAAVPQRPSAASLQPQDIYQAAYIDFSKGSYSLAIAGFREFLRRYPDHELAGSAQYWIGEAYLSLARGFSDSGQGDKSTESLEQAVQEFKKVLVNYPRADKVPPALYKEALALIDLKQPAQAQARLQYLVDNFPRSEETNLARERLATLKNR
ncbi:MAG TPA: outer membrane protein assembly factor BamD [Methylomirabilota bacterium]|nr:outer membrane protein assembly factor BamD [Methylomirabilota bacterium]